MAKSNGPGWERQTAKLLSVWWTEGERDDVFWRSSNSGGRATVRAKGGRKTAGQYGDIAATDAIGQPLIDVITFELKVGYSSRSIHDLLDREPKSAMQVWEEFIHKAHRSHEQAGSYTWAIVTRRTYRRAMIWFPEEFLVLARTLGAFGGCPHPLIRIRCTCRNKLNKQPAVGRVAFVGMHLAAFIHEENGVTPDIIRELAKRHVRQKEKQAGR